VTLPTIDLDAHDRAVREALEALGRPVGYTEAPPGALDALLADPPGPDYFVLYPLPGLRRGSLRHPFEDVEAVYQVTIVAATPEGARFHARTVEEALALVTFPDRHVVRFIPEGPGDVRADRQDVSPHAYIATPRFRWWTTPAA
jgi:hypothetical protein